MSGTLPRSHQPLPIMQEVECACGCGKRFTPKTSRSGIIAAQFFATPRCRCRYRDRVISKNPNDFIPGLDLLEPARDYPRCRKCLSVLPKPGLCQACMVERALKKAMGDEARARTRLKVHKMLTAQSKKAPEVEG